MNRPFRLGWSFAALLVVAGSTQAAPLLLSSGTPDITSSDINVNYNGTTGILTATGNAIAIDFDGVPPPDYAIKNGVGGFQINVTLDPMTGEPVSGSLAILGKVSELSASSGTLLTGTLFDFGYDGPILEFLFTPTGGDLQGLFQPQIGVILSAFSDSDFAPNQNYVINDASAFADTFPVPEPTSLLAWSVLAFGSGIVWRRQQKAKLSATV